MYGSQGGVISYLGQPFINFTYFFDTLELPETRMNVVFPFICDYILGIGAPITAIQKYLSLSTGKTLWVFYAFYGHIYL